ncbi:MAG TPA: 2,3-diaminopropionate biosynthesis protein SbnB [Longimicrobiaceae bacterium]|nr:2,3-diaminopropionate biosynthesis protein SbnB [Longimicrobiaceae bacterium]
MSDRDDILVVRGEEIVSLLEGRERQVIDLVRGAYEVHERGESSLPHSSFLRFPRPGQERDRVIALPAYLGDGFDVAGIKWISSFPGNLERGIDRASAALILNSTETGRPQAFLESSVISAKRTAASAALGASVLHRDADVSRLGLVGCGLINFEITRFLLAVFPGIRTLVLHDMDPARAALFGRQARRLSDRLEAVVVESPADVLAGAPLVSFGTTAVTPHVGDVSACPPGATILHVSLRDLTPEVILAADNVVDDADHVCRAQTSVHLAEQQTGGRDFIRSSLARITSGAEPARPDPERISVFSPFGLGVLDLAVGQLVQELAREQGIGTRIGDFFPRPWGREEPETAAASGGWSPGVSS